MQGKRRKRRGNAEDTRLADCRAERMQRVGLAYLRGTPVIEIAKLEGLNRDAIYKDLAMLRRIWWKRNNRASDKLVAEQAAKLDAAEAAAWQGWERSCSNFEETTVESGGAEGKGKTTKKTRGQSGDPAFLSVIAKIVEQRCRLLRVGQYASEDSGVMVGKLVEIVVENAEQINRIMDFGEFDKLTDQSNVIEGEVVKSDENPTDPDQ
jgi:hypothetical protein